MSDALKPCPFCGSNDLGSGGDDKIVGYWCNNCQTTGPNHYDSRHDWNTRADIPATDEQIAARLHECVKPLEWVDSGIESHATTMFGSYLIANCHEEGFGLWTVGADIEDGPNLGYFPTLEAAKAAAQAHYTAQIMAALDLSAFKPADPAADPKVQELVEAANCLRDAQRAYMSDRGNDKLGQNVAIAAERLDTILAQFNPEKETE